jgi:hypothetical protein
VRRYGAIANIDDDHFTAVGDARWSALYDGMNAEISQWVIEQVGYLLLDPIAHSRLADEWRKAVWCTVILYAKDQ